MKKGIYIVLFLLLGCLYADEKVNVTKDSFLSELNLPQTAYLYDFSLSRKENEIRAKENNKFILEIWRETNSDFIRKNKINLSSKIFKSEEEKTIENVKRYMKNGINIFEEYGNRNLIMLTWFEESENGVSIQYTQDTLSPITGAGIYLFRVFLDSYVYNFRLSDFILLDEQYSEFEALSKYMYFKPGQKLDLERGIEQTQGYYWKSIKSVAQFYDDLILNPETFPSKHVQSFYKTKMEIEESIRKIIGAKTSLQKVTTNLRIREVAKSGKSILTIQEGTNVRVLSMGAEDVIDGIKGNWVNVVIPQGSKDKDGNEIKKSFYGWCFDGYLK
ncbi:MAG: hypothetical protein E7060_04255 [Treponema bryantii]|nr:hypothetical protein [Treponema bryantii]